MGFFDDYEYDNDDDGKFEYEYDDSSDGSFDYGDGNFLGDDKFYAESDDWFDEYDSSFELPGATDKDPNYLGKIWEGMNTPLGSGLILGAAGGAANYLADESRSDLYKSNLDDRKDTRARHNASINKPFSGAKKVTYKDK